MKTFKDLTPFQKRLHLAVIEAMIETLENDQSQQGFVPFREMQEYFKIVPECLKMAFAFCPEREGILQLLRAEQEERSNVL